VIWPDKPEAAAGWLENRLKLTDGVTDYGVDRPVELPGPLRPAAVLIALIWHDITPTVLLTRRAQQLPTHAGQVSLPGGKRERSDLDFAATALREAWEEVGLEQGAVRVVGQLARYVTITGFSVSPIVGLVTPPLQLKPDPCEVEEVFEVPLELVLNPAAYRREAYQLDGGRRGEYWVLNYEPEHVWGATAAMLRGLAMTLAGQPPYAAS